MAIEMDSGDLRAICLKTDRISGWSLFKGISRNKRQVKSRRKREIWMTQGGEILASKKLSSTLRASAGFKSRRRAQGELKQQNPLSMRHSSADIFIHAYWTTLNCQPLIEPHLLSFFHCFIRFQFTHNQCHSIHIRGNAEKIHCIFQLPASKSLAQVIKQVKGNSSLLMNKYRLSASLFRWEVGYTAYSISDQEIEKSLNSIRLEIAIQELLE